MYLYYAVGGHCKALHYYSKLHHKYVPRYQGSFLVLSLIIIVGLSLLPNVFVPAKVKKYVASGNVIALYNKGLALYDSGNNTGAILYYDKALAMDPHYIHALTHKGLALDNLGNYSGAIRYYDKALAIQPKDIYTLTDKGAALADLGNYTGAILYYDKVLAMDPYYVHALAEKGTALDDLGNHTGAILYHDKVLAILKHPFFNK
jgi:tetratricopeptide (TPR) repeat protein